jgi:hypothetical protein
MLPNAIPNTTKPGNGRRPMVCYRLLLLLPLKALMALVCAAAARSLPNTTGAPCTRHCCLPLP